MRNESANSTVEQLKKTIEEQNLEILALRAVIDKLRGSNDPELIKRYKMRMLEKFSASTEQLDLFNDPETTLEEGALTEMPDDQGINVNSYTRRKSRSGVSLPADTPVVDIYEDAGAPECERCGSRMVEAGEKVYESFTRIDRTIIVRKHVRQYTCPNCLPEKGEDRIVVTPASGNMLDGTVCDPTLLAYCVDEKYRFAMTLYREAARFCDVGLSRFTISAWMMKVGTIIERNMEPLLEKLVYSYPMINVDESGLKIIRLRKDDGSSKAPNSRYNAWMLARAAVDGNGRNGPRIFTFMDNRRNGTITEILSGYSGVVQTDGLAGYESADRACSFTHIGCLVHSRRKALDAYKIGKYRLAADLLEKYGRFFHEEGLLRDRFVMGKFSDGESYVAERKKILGPLLDDIHSFCEQNREKAVSCSPLYTAFSYPLERWDTLVRFLEYPFATSSNNAAERCIRPYAISRKNSLFNITECGARVSAFYYSLIESCKAMGIDTQDYLTHLFMNAGSLTDGGDTDKWEALLPGKCDICDAVRYRERLLLAKSDPERTEPYQLRGKRV